MERPWIEHDGSGLPVPIGTIVDCRHRDGNEDFGFPAGKSSYGGGPNNYDPTWNCWLWEPQPCDTDIVVYRLAIDPQAECDRASSRQEMFRDIGAGKSFPSIPDPNPIFEPVEPAVPAKRREWSR